MDVADTGIDSLRHGRRCTASKLLSGVQLAEEGRELARVWEIFKQVIPMGSHMA